VYEANDDIGGGARSAELTLPGFIHDVCGYEQGQLLEGAPYSERDFRAPQEQATSPDLVIDVAELVWEPIAD
jgi:phytoene dehydrogenase-like protein